MSLIRKYFEIVLFVNIYVVKVIHSLTLTLMQNVRYEQFPNILAFSFITMTTIVEFLNSGLLKENIFNDS